MRVLVLDPTRSEVIAAVPVEPGATTHGSGLGAPVHGGATVRDVDGRRRIYAEADVPGVGWHVLAGYDEGRALAAASSQRRWMLATGGSVLAVVVVLGLALQRRLARPVRRLGQAIEAARRGDAGPVAEVAAPSRSRRRRRSPTS